MQFNVLRLNGQTLLRGAAVVVIAGVASGCSSQVARFNGGTGVDGIFTGSTPNQRAIINPGNSQSYPGDSQPIAAAPVDGTYSGSVSRGALAPVSTAPVTQASAQPIRVASAPAPTYDATTTGAVEPAPAAIQGDSKGWSRAGGTQVTVKQGETVYNLSRRFGVPADVIMQANGISEADGLKAGSKVIIPTYVYGKNAPVSSPDSNPKTANASSSRGDKQPSKPDSKPFETVAVLPEQPKLKQGQSAPTTSNTDGAQAKAGGAGGTYTVQSGDTLSKISRNTGVSVAAIKQANGMDDGLIRIGQTLKLPAGGTASVAQAATDPVKTGSAGTAKAEQVAAYTPPKKTEKVIQQSDETAPDATGIGRMRWPVRGRVITQFGTGGGKSTDGIDILVPEGTPIKSAENGVVIYAGDGLKEFGNTVLVRHEDGLVTVYGHASELKVARGDKVKRGQEIAVSGMSGTTDAPKLHFEVRKNSAPVDPTTYLE
jgi:murein DD-endopeptidase MepM/ murein hydrolase activator NlpD